MLILAAALLLAGPPSVRADDPAPNTQLSEPDPRDTDGDGVVSGKERRQARRAARRARRRANAAAGGKDMTDEDADAADAKAAADAGSAATGNASGAASAMKNSLTPTDAGGGVPPGGGAGGSNAGGPGAGPGGVGSAGGTAGGGKGSAGAFVGGAGAGTAFTAGASGDPAHPKAPADFALSAHSGYSPAFAKAGLKLAPDGRTVTRLDGKPATAEDYARLQREIDSMPRALGRRPDFFSAVSPEHYSDLKQGYKTKKDGDPVYKDVGTTEGDRDFVHTASCDKLSGDCNKSVEKGSYKKGDYVAPEDLDNMWSALQKELDASADQSQTGGLPDPGTARSDLARQKAIETAKSIYEDSRSGNGETAASGSKPSPEKVVTPVSQAVDSVRKIWKSAATLAFPGAAGGKDGGNGSLLLVIGAAAFVALGGGILFLRRKG